MQTEANFSSTTDQPWAKHVPMEHLTDVQHTVAYYNLKLVKRSDTISIDTMKREEFTQTECLW